MGEINAAYPVLFNAGGMEGDAVDGEDEGGGEDGQDSGGFGRRWGWVSCVDAVSETCRCPWSEVWAIGAVEFLNLLCYRRDRAERDRRALEEWKRRH